jgi:hypothetical protein
LVLDTQQVVGILFAITISSGAWVTLSNPVDDNVIVSKEARTAEVVIPKGKHVIDERNYCCLCKVHVYVPLFFTMFLD